MRDMSRSEWFKEKSSAKGSDVMREHYVTNPFTAPIHAPDADPGFTKKWLSYSTAWNLRDVSKTT